MSNKFRCYVLLAYNVILNVVKNLSVCTHREMFRFAQHDRCGRVGRAAKA